MTHDELRAEVRAIIDLHQRLGDHIEILTRRLFRHFETSPGGGKTERLTMTQRDVWPPSGREDDGWYWTGGEGGREDDGSD